MNELGYDAGVLRNILVTIGGTSLPFDNPQDNIIIDKLTSIDNKLEAALETFCYVARICIIFSILNNGPNVMYKDGVKIANKYVEERSIAYKTGKEINLQQIKNQFNFFMLKLAEDVEYPFSSGIFKGEDKRSTKFHTGVSIDF